MVGLPMLFILFFLQRSKFLKPSGCHRATLRRTVTKWLSDSARRTILHIYIYIPSCPIPIPECRTGRTRLCRKKLKHVLVCFLAVWMQYLVDVLFVSPSGKPLCHGVNDGEDKVDYHSQKDVAKHPGEFAGFLHSREGKWGSHDSVPCSQVWRE